MNSVHFLVVSVATMFFCGTECQKFNFGNWIEDDKSCPVTSGGNWSIEGSVTMATSDLIMFQPKVVINSITELCTIDLTSCSPNSQLKLPDKCYCKRKNRDEYSLHIGQHIITSQNSGSLIQAMIPTKEMFSPVTASTIIGKIPEISDEKHLISVFYYVDNNPVRTLLPAQNLTVCRQTFVTIHICATGNHPDRLLQITAADQTILSSSKCVKWTESYNFEDVSSHELRFSYRVSVKCPHSANYVLNIYEKQHSCPTSAQTITTKTPVQSTQEVMKPEPTKAEVIKSSTTMSAKSATTSTTKLEMTTSTSPEHESRETKVLTTSSSASVTSLLSNTEMIAVDKACSQSKTSTAENVVTLSNGLSVRCDTQSDGGDWVYIQRRVTAEVDFFRGWTDYVEGFGNLKSNFWLGLETIHRLCNEVKQCELRVDMEYPGKPNDATVYQYVADYNKFYIDGAYDKYRLHVDGWSGNVTDSLIVDSNDRQFATFDNDNDNSNHNCGIARHSGWWFNNCCKTNPNGRWGHAGDATAMYWVSLTGYPDFDSLRSVKMKVRQK